MGRREASGRSCATTAGDSDVQQSFAKKDSTKLVRRVNNAADRAKAYRQQGWRRVAWSDHAAGTESYIANTGEVRGVQAAARVTNTGEPVVRDCYDSRIQELYDFSRVALICGVEVCLWGDGWALDTVRSGRLPWHHGHDY